MKKAVVACYAEGEGSDVIRYVPFDDGQKRVTFTRNELLRKIREYALYNVWLVKMLDDVFDGVVNTELIERKYPECGEVWQHYKGESYLVTCMSKMESRPDQVMVNYQRLNSGESSWVRAVEEFMEKFVFVKKADK